VFRPDNECILAANPPACELYGYSEPELVGMDLRRISAAPERGRHALDVRPDDLTAAAGVETHGTRPGRSVEVRVSVQDMPFEERPAKLALDRQGSIRYISASFCRVLGRRTEDLVGRSAIGDIHPDSQHSRDITGRRRTEEAPRESDERLRLAHQAAGIGS
jgi:PAS domain-containing protein